MQKTSLPSSSTSWQRVGWTNPHCPVVKTLKLVIYLFLDFRFYIWFQKYHISPYTFPPMGAMRGQSSPSLDKRQDPRRHSTVSTSRKMGRIANHLHCFRHSVAPDRRYFPKQLMAVIGDLFLVNRVGNPPLWEWHERLLHAHHRHSWKLVNVTNDDTRSWVPGFRLWLLGHRSPKPGGTFSKRPKH
jgi:hypothetical protein